MQSTTVTQAAETDTEQCVALLQRLIAIESLSGHEGALTEQVVRELTQLGLREIEVDAAGNVLAVVRGRGEAPPLMLNTHLDHVDVGDVARWPHPPFAAHHEAGVVWGRGAVDIKGPMAAQIAAIARLAQGEAPPGDVWISMVVQEEVGGLGARFLAARSPARIVVVGEPSSNTLRRGHRGRVLLEAHLTGRSAHASVPHQGRNPLFALAALLTALHEQAGDLPFADGLGRSTAAPTLLRTDQTSSNVIPAEVWQAIDYRCIAGESSSSVRARLQALGEAVATPFGCTVEVCVPVRRVVSYTGHTLDMPADNPAYLLDADLPELRAAAAIRRRALYGSSAAASEDADEPAAVWNFATDGGHFARAGLLPIGFGPGDELLAHTVDERIEVAELIQAVRVYEALARELTQTLG
ncbi:MAG: M20/M25/M40 family metallo-hydrolase [Acidobacteria bacterium]|nr:MAG: M20/M25/M40 family metallo-hydrolase [Acidobacteriota bacterium]